MSTEDKTGEIIRLLTELTVLVKALQPKVENHTHHHYPTNPTYYYPNQWTSGTGGYSTTIPTSGGNYTTPVPGMTTTWSTNDQPGNGTDTPSA